MDLMDGREKGRCNGSYKSEKVWESEGTPGEG